MKVTKNKQQIITTPVSRYNPDEEVKIRLKEILKDFQDAKMIADKPYSQFNDKSILSRQSEDQQSFNTWIEAPSADPDESWHSRAIRPIVRNRSISIAAHVTGSLMFPQVYAQNDQDQEDKDSASVMRDLMEWTAEQSNYVQTFLYAVIAALVNPATIVHTEYAKVMRDVKVMKEDGSWTAENILDEELSGFQDTIVPVDELYIGDIYQHNIQKQPFLIWRKAIDYSIAKSKYGDDKNFKDYIRPGLQIFFDDNTGQFYEAYDQNLRERLVEEIIYWNRSADLRIVICNGVMLSDPDQPNPRNDKRYPFVKGGYELVDEGKFFYYYSLVRKMAHDESVLTTLYRMVIDGTFLSLMPPTNVYGDEHFTSSVVTPGAINEMKKDSKLEVMNVGSNIATGLGVIEKVEGSISESSNDELQSGMAPSKDETAFEISRREQNAKIMLGLFSKMIGFMVKDYGELRVSDILQFLTVADADKITSDSGRLKFQTFLMPDKNSGGKTKTRSIQFDQNFQPATTPDEAMTQSFDIMKQEGGLNTDKEIMLVNPKLFRERKFKIKITPEVVSPPSDVLKKALNLELYDRAIANPMADQQEVTKELLFGSYDATKGDTEKFMMKQQPGMMPSQLPGQAPMQGGGTGVLSKLLGNKQPQQSLA